MKYFIKQLLIDLLIVWPLIYVSIFSGSDYAVYAENIIFFYAIIISLMFLPAILLNGAVVEKMTKSEVRIKSHTYFMVTSSVVEMLIFASAGWHFVAISWALCLFASLLIHTESRKKEF